MIFQQTQGAAASCISAGLVASLDVRPTAWCGLEATSFQSAAAQHSKAFPKNAGIQGRIPSIFCLSIRSKGGQNNALKTLSLFNFTRVRDLALLLPFQTPAGSLPLEQAWMQKR